MKLLSYRIEDENRYGVLSGDGIVDASTRLEGAATLRDVLSQDRLAEMQDAIRKASPDHALDEIDFLLPITEPRKILCAGRNYPAYHEVDRDTSAPRFPSIFGRFTNSLSPHHEAILKPLAGEQLDYEGELVVIIGKKGRHVPEAEAFEHVAGYTCMNEGTVRDWMGKGTQNTPAKNFYRSGALGPWIVTADEISDPSELRITTRRNGDVVQDSDTESMIFDIPFLIAHISKFTVLEPGDLIATGSPGGSAVGAESPEWLREGEVIEVEISRLGTLMNPIAAE